MIPGHVAFDLKCRALKVWRTVVRTVKPRARSQRFLFVLCPPYAGSTLMHEILCSSRNVSATNVFGVREGHGLPEIRRLVGHEHDWDAGFDYPWPAIKAHWLQYWDTSKPVLMDKSPPNLLRAVALQQCFDPADFIVMTRDPYAHAEAMMRRNRLDAAAAAAFSLRCLEHQRDNLERLERTCLVRYEDLIADGRAVAQRLSDFVPALGTLRVDGTFTAHNREGRALPLTDFNAPGIGRLTAPDLAHLTAAFGRSTTLLARFGYRLIA